MSRYTSSSYRTALVAASFRGDCEGVQSLLDIDLPDGMTQAMKRTFCNVSLLKAAHGNHADVVRILLAAGAAVSNPNSQGNTALHIAAEQGHMRVSSPSNTHAFHRSHRVRFRPHDRCFDYSKTRSAFSPFASGHCPRSIHASRSRGAGVQEYPFFHVTARIQLFPSPVHPSARPHHLV